MSAGEPEDGAAPLGQGESVTLEAELREALQHRHAEIERMRETQAELEALLERARILLGREPDSGGG